MTAGEDRHGWLRYIDSLAKLVAAGAILAAAIIAGRYESKMTSLSLLSQREQSESALRASMFQNLIDPIVGEPDATGEIALARQQLLVELLTLNFHDHFEFKPLLIDLDERLLRAKRERERDQLSALALRVLERQTHILNVAAQLLDEDQKEIRIATLVYRSPAMRDDGADAGPAVLGPVLSPDGRWEVKLAVHRVDFERRRALVTLNMRPTGTEPWRGLDFELTQFDFPLTDYRQLTASHRVAVAMAGIYPRSRAMRVELMWFPPGYITERERPFDYESVRKALRLEKVRATAPPARTASDDRAAPVDDEAS